MAPIGNSPSGGGGGSGFSLGPEQNEFATVTLRNTYTTANAAWLALYNDDRSFWIDVNDQIQRRNAAGDDWEDVTAVVRGPAGAASTVPGPAGQMGTDGADGATGTQGQQGATGGAGAAGMTGATGNPGPAGPPGTPGGQGTATPPTTIVNAIPYTVHGSVTVGSWRDYDFLQFIYFDGSNYFPVIPIATFALELANASADEARLAFEQNTSFNIYSTDGSDNIAISFHNSGPSVGANSTMTVIGWRSGSQGADGSDGASGMDGAQGPAGPAGSGATFQVQDEGSTVVGGIETLKVVGANAVISTVGTVATLTITGGGVAPTHTEQYLAGKATQNFVPNDFTGSSGVAYSAGSHTATLPAQQGAVYAAVARISTDPEPTYADVNSQGINAFSDFTKQAAEIAINGAMYEVWVSDYQIFVTGDQVEWR